MTTFIPNTFTRITAANTWTEVAGATKGLAGGVTVAELDGVIVNWATSAAEVLIAITADSTPPASDDVAIRPISLAADRGFEPFDAVLTGDEHIWVKSDQTDTRVNIVGSKEAVV